MVMASVSPKVVDNLATGISAGEKVIKAAKIVADMNTMPAVTTNFAGVEFVRHAAHVTGVVGTVAALIAAHPLIIMGALALGAAALCGTSEDD